MKQFKKIFSLPHNLVAEGAPVCIQRGLLLYEHMRERFAVQLKLKNISQKEIVGVTVSITETNAQGIHYRERVTYTYNTGPVAPNGTFGAKKGIMMPHKGVRRFSVSICEVRFADDTTWSGEDAVFAPAPAQAPLVRQLPHNAQVAWRHHFGKRAIYAPEAHNEYWLCSCATLNAKDAAVCSGCGADHSELFGASLKKLEAEGFVHRVQTLAERGDDASFEEAEALVEMEVPEGVNQEALCSYLNAVRKKRKDKQARRRTIRRRVVILLSSAAVLVLSFALLFALYLLPNSHYQRAKGYKANGLYYEAYCEFLQCENFKDSEDWIALTREGAIDETMRLIDEGEIEEAQDIIYPFRDSAHSEIYKELPIIYRVYLTALYGDGSSVDSPILIERGESVTMWFTDDITYFVFAPQATRSYHIYSIEDGYNRGDVDIVVYDENFVTMESDTSSGDADIDVYLRRDNIYFIAVNGYGGAVKASIHFD